MNRKKLNNLELAQAIADMLKEKTGHEQITALEIAALLLFPKRHAKLVIEPH